MDHHLSSEGSSSNSRNGYGKKTVLTEDGSLELSIPRDRQSSFDPQLLAKYPRRFPGFNGQIISMYARGMSTREIVGHVQELYGVDVSPNQYFSTRQREPGILVNIHSIPPAEPKPDES